MTGASDKAPRYLVATGPDATTVLRRLARAGWHTRDGFALPEASWDVTDRQGRPHGRVADRTPPSSPCWPPPAARASSRSRRRHATRPGPARRPVPASARAPPRRGAEPDADDGEVPVPEQRALLERLANGETIAAAAAAEFLSLRTANRRIAEAREVLGVRTTREAVLAYLRIRRDA